MLQVEGNIFCSNQILQYIRLESEDFSPSKGIFEGIGTTFLCVLLKYDMTQNFCNNLIFHVWEVYVSNMQSCHMDVFCQIVSYGSAL